MKSIREINMYTKEGRLLLAALGTISSLPGYTDKTPDEILRDVESRTIKSDHLAPSDNYASLSRVLEHAYDQAAVGKGHERHVVKDEPFEEQLICWLQRRGYDGCRFQAAKKIDESLRRPPEAAIRELLGAINFISAAIIVLEEEANANKEAS